MSSRRCWTGSSESQSLIHLSSSAVYGGSADAGAPAASGTDAADAGTFVVGGVADMTM